jgi:glutaryl-CoA dehydrogenase
MNVQSPLTQKPEYSPPPRNGDFYRIADVLDDSERAIVKRVREFMEDEVTAGSQRCFCSSSPHR